MLYKSNTNINRRLPTWCKDRNDAEETGVYWLVGNIPSGFALWRGQHEIHEIWRLVMFLNAACAGLTGGFPGLLKQFICLFAMQLIVFLQRIQSYIFLLNFTRIGGMLLAFREATWLPAITSQSVHQTFLATRARRIGRETCGEGEN